MWPCCSLWPVKLRVVGTGRPSAFNFSLSCFLRNVMRSPSALRVQAAFARLNKHAFTRPFFLLDVMLDLLRADFHLGVEEVVVGRAIYQFGDHDLRPIVLDIGFVHLVFLDLALAGPLEDFLLDHHVHAKF